MKSCNWEKGTLTVYERVREPKKGFRKSDFWINNLWEEKKLCKKYIYEEGKYFPLAKSIERAEQILEHEKKMKENEKKWFKRLFDFELYEGFTNNCEHTVRSLKTGKSESLQIFDLVRCKGCRGGCSIVLKCFKILRYARLLRGPIFGSVEYPIDNICDFNQKRGRICKLFEKLDHFFSKEDYINIGIEVCWGFIFYVLWRAGWEILLWHQKKKGELTEDNYEDERMIMKWDMGGFVLGLGLSVLLVIGFQFASCHKIFLLVVEFALYILLTFCSSNALRNLGISKVRERHEKKEYKGNKKEKYRQISKSAPALIAIHKELQSAGSAPVLLMKHEDEANREKYLQSVPGLLNDSPV